MAKSGIMEKIWQKYTYTPPNVQCEEQKVGRYFNFKKMSDSNMSFLEPTWIQSTCFASYFTGIWNNS